VSLPGGGRGPSATERAALRHAKARLDRLGLYPAPVRLRRTVRIVSVPWLFRLPWFLRFDGYTVWDLVLLRRPLEEVSPDLICHELCHVWQMQHRPLAMPLSYLRHGYARNPYEAEARRAVELTREAPSPAGAEPGLGS
jgi:hypothetical protein